MVLSYQLFIVILGFFEHAHAVTVRPSLCPTNKIAPYNRLARWDRRNARTLSAFYELLTPNGNNDGFPRPPHNSLLEEAQQDDLDDCGEIEDYDENDLSSLVTSQRRQGESRLFFGALLGQHQNQRPQHPQHVQFPQVQRPENSQPQRPIYAKPQYPQPVHPQQPVNQQPQRPQYPPQYPQQSQEATRPPRPNYPPARPPYASGGFFSSNPYRPPAQLYPSDNIKPVHENDSEAHMIYRPDLVGGPSGHVVGAKPVRPPQRPLADEPTRDPYKRFPQRPNQEANDRKERPRRLNSNGSIVGSFIDLLFK